jgi:hypothetical protein
MFLITIISKWGWYYFTSTIIKFVLDKAKKRRILSDQKLGYKSPKIAKLTERRTDVNEEGICYYYFSAFRCFFCTSRLQKRRAETGRGSQS